MARKIKVADVTVAAGGHAPVESSRISQNQGVHQGKMIGFKMVISNCVNAINVVLQIKDSDGDMIYTSAGTGEGRDPDCYGPRHSFGGDGTRLSLIRMQIRARAA